MTDHFQIGTSMNDAGLAIAALLGMLLTAGAILRDTRHRLSHLRAVPRTDDRVAGQS